MGDFGLFEEDALRGHPHHGSSEDDSLVVQLAAELAVEAAAEAAVMWAVKGIGAEAYLRRLPVCSECFRVS